VVRDISERCRAIRTIERLAKFPDENPNPILRISSDSAIIYANQSSKELLGQWGSEVGQLLPDNYRNIIEKALKSGKSSEIECAAGKTVYSLVFAPIVDMDYVNIYGEDITKRKQAESALIESEEMYRTHSEAAPDLVFIINKDDKVEYVNNVAAKYLNMQPQEVIGRARSELFPPDVCDAQKLGLQKVFDDGEAVRNSVSKATFCGRDVWMILRSFP
jgi:two-component system CheB/CheR fusion protein